MILLPILIRLARGRSPEPLRRQGAAAAITRLAAASGCFAPGRLTLTSRKGTAMAGSAGHEPAPIADIHLAVAMGAAMARADCEGTYVTTIPARSDERAEADARAIEAIARSLGGLDERQTEAFAMLAIRRRSPSAARLAA